MSTRLDDLVESFVGNEKETERESIIRDIVNNVNKSSSILPLIVVLGKFLISATSDTQRKDSILIIYKVLQNCNNLQLNISELTNIINFLLSRFEHDLTCQPYIIITIDVLYNKYHQQLSSHKNGQLFIQIITTILTKLDYEQIKLKIKSPNKSSLNYNQFSRQQLLKLLNHSIINYTNLIINKINNNNDDLFIDGCSKLIDGESDPRNILLSFNLYQSIFNYFSNQILSKHVQVQYPLKIRNTMYPCTQ